MNTTLDLVEQGWVPDRLVRLGIKGLLTRRLRQEQRRSGEVPRQALGDFLDELRRSPIAVRVEKANEQHYALPPAFFQKILGKRLKYSGCYW